MIELFHRNRRTTRNRILGRFLISYLVLLIIPILTALIIHRQTVQLLEAEVQSANMLILTQARDIVDRYLEELDLTIKRLALNPTVHTLLHTERIKRGDPDIINVIKAFEAISSYSITNDFVKELYIYSRKNDILLSTEKVHTELQIDYNYFFRFADLDYSTWHDGILNGHYKDLHYLPQIVSMAEQEHSFIFCARSIPLNSGAYFTGNVFALIDKRKIQELLLTLNTGDQGYGYITDSRGGLLVRFPGDGRNIKPLNFELPGRQGLLRRRLDGREWMVSYTTSEFTGWRYVSVLPKSFFMSKVNYIKRIIWIITLFFLILGLMIAFLLAHRSSKPIIEIASLARSSFADPPRLAYDFDFIKKSVSRLVSSNRELENIHRQELPLMRASFWDRLLKGAIQNEQELRVLLRHNEISFTGNCFLVILVAVGGYGDLIKQGILKDMDLNRIIIKEKIAQHFPTNVYPYDVAGDRIALICCFAAESQCRQPLEDRLTTIHAELLDQYRIRVLFAAGGICLGLMSLNSSFAAATQALEYGALWQRESVLLRSGEVVFNNAHYFYPLELESRLILLTKAGNKEEVDKILSALYEKNLNQKQLSISMIHRLLDHLRGTLIRLLNEINIDPSIDELLPPADAPGSIDEDFGRIREAFSYLGDFIYRSRKEAGKQFRNQIIDYIEQAHSRCELNLYLVASEFNLKESYLYYYFKEHLGATFSSYLESYRIRRACALLLSGADLSIDEIACRVGYGNAHSFRRAFKRCKGLSPSEFQRVQSG